MSDDNYTITERKERQTDAECNTQVSADIGSGEETENGTHEKKKDFAASFVNGVRHSIYTENPLTYQMRRHLGKSLDTDYSGMVPFYSVACYGKLKKEFDKEELQNKWNRKTEDLLYLVECMICTTTRKNNRNNVKYIKYEEILGRVAKSSKSSANAVGYLLNINYRDKRMFLKMHAHVFNRCRAMLRQNEDIDYVELLRDLLVWDSEIYKHSVRSKWAKAIASATIGLSKEGVN